MLGDMLPGVNPANTATKTILPKTTTAPERMLTRKVVKATAAPLRMLNGGIIIASTPVPTEIKIAWTGPRKMNDANDFILWFPAFQPSFQH
jgi:hypothetical protein